MKDFLPEGYRWLADAHAAMDGEILGARLAAGRLIAYRVNPWGEFIVIDAQFWSGPYGRPALEAGEVPRKTPGGMKLAEGGQKIAIKLPPTTSATTYTTGGAGRPTSRHLVEAECRRRLASGIAESTKNAEASYLERWLKSNHPNAAPMSTKTILTHIRKIHRLARN